jgi:DNA-binding transcriptional LysR family regulator
VAVVPATSPLVATPQLGVRHLRGQALLGIVRSAHEDVVEEHLVGAGVADATFERYDDNQLVQSLVAGGQGIAVLPWLTVDHDDEGVRVLPLDVGLPPRRIGLIHHGDRLLGPAAREFRSVAVEVCRSLLRQRPDEDELGAEAS